jgi:pantoate--beta-alanine ligase
MSFRALNTAWLEDQAAMQILHHITELRAQLTVWWRRGERVALVPTMGNLHAGHIHLVEQASTRADRLVVSIFVNPMQFGPNEDYHGYPRTLAEDCDKLQRLTVDLLFAPSVAEIYPRGLEGTTHVEVTGLSQILCGAVRPLHFRGVATVVSKLFNIVQPRVAVFGEKDWQQLVIIRRMVEDLNFPVDILGVPTVREADGLAMSSRNRYLSAAERAIAPTLFATLSGAAARLKSGQQDYGAIESDAWASLEAAGFRPEYFEVRRAHDLGKPDPVDSELVVMAAAWLGRARLIDNYLLTPPTGTDSGP